MKSAIVVSMFESYYKFTGKERDVETGLDYFIARHYSSNLGRFVSPDPFMASGRVENPQTWNRYTYALNNPLRFIDPFGLFASPAYNCTENDDACLNAQQREILENSEVEIDGQVLSGEALYNALSEEEQNAFVNITDRLASIAIDQDTTALGTVQSITSFQPDRIIATVSGELATHIATDPQFKTASGVFHGEFGAASFKSRRGRPIIQFSFNEGRTAVDMDHDLRRGIFGHMIGEVVVNTVTGSRTNQDKVRRLLIARPKIAITPSPDPNFNRPSTSENQ